MATSDKLKLGSSVSLDLYPAAILGTGYTNAKVQAVVDMTTAKALGFDPEAMHVNVYPTLPPGTPDDPRQYLYVKLLLQSGQSVIVGLPWIKEETIREIQFTTLAFKVQGVGPDDYEKVIKALAANGYTAVDVTFIS